MIPVRLTGGSITYAFACGVCQQVHAQWNPFPGPRAQPSDEEITGSFDRAQSCCTCRGGCGTQVPRDRIGHTRWWHCDTCAWWSRFAYVWEEIGREISGPPEDAHPSEFCKCEGGPYGETHVDGCRWAKVMCTSCSGYGHCPSCRGEGCGPITIVEREIAL